MKAAFVCFRPYQVFNAINMVYHNIEQTKGRSDLYVQDLPALKAMVPHLASLGVFENVYVFSELNHGDKANVGRKQQTKIYLVRTKNFIFAHSALKKNCYTKPEGGFRQYDLILASGWISFFIELANCNPKARVVLFEDGTANYVYDQIASLAPIRKKYYGFLKKVFNKGPLCMTVSALYVNNPGMMIGTRPYPVYPLGEYDDGLLDLLARAYNYDKTEEIYKNKEVVFLGQPQTTLNVPTYSETELVRNLSVMTDMVYRKHPLQKDLETFACEDTVRPMWELACRNIDENCALVAQFSTAQITPYMVYGKCPTLVFFYKISCKPSSRRNTYKQLIDMVRQNYTGKIYEPETMEELYEIIRDLKK